MRRSVAAADQVTSSPVPAPASAGCSRDSTVGPQQGWFWLFWPRSTPVKLAAT
jgi:hypothetical protein